MTAVTPELRRIALAELHESPLNPRKHYDEEALKQLAESLQASGQITPITVRPSANGKGGYELAAGHRRSRAALQAGLTHLDAVVREDLKGDDPAFIEILNVDNLQRDDLHPLEEAQGFRTLMEKAGYDIPKISARIGKSTKYVYDRLKLLQLIKPAQKLFLEGKFEAGHAILLARLSPLDQQRAIGDPSDRHNFSDNRIGGLFLPEHVDDDGDLGLEEEPRKPASVREFQEWINDNVRFKPAEVDLPNLFPETAAALAAAKEEELKVVKITRDYRVPDEAKDPKERTYGEASWKRADGKSEPARFSGKATPGKTCEYSVMGILVAGPGRGEAFKVCVNKDKCAVHWAAERKEKAARAKSSNGNGGGPANYAAKQKAESQKWERQRKEREAEQKRFQKAVPALLEALAEKLKALPAAGEGVLVKFLLGRVNKPSKAALALAPGAKTAEDVVRRAVFLEIAGDIEDLWNGQDTAAAHFKALGLDATKIVDQVAPKEKPVQTSATPGIKLKPKKLAGDVARARAKKKAKARAA